MTEDVAAAVAAHIEAATDAVRNRDIEAVVRCLANAVGLYEGHPSLVHEPTSRLRDLLVFIRSARSLCKTLQREMTICER